MPRPERPIAIVGCGYTEVTRKLIGSEVSLVIAACKAAAEDAGITTSEIDGINVQVHHYPPPDTQAVAEGLGMTRVNWRQDGGFGLDALGSAVKALQAGVCDYAVVCKVMNTSAPVSTPVIDGGSGKVSGPDQFEVPYGLGYSMQRVALTTRRWMHRYGIKPEQVAALAIAERENALLNPHAFFKSPLSMDEYFASRWIAEPVRLLDCDYPVNGAYAYLLAAEPRARDLRHPPVYVRSWAVEEGNLHFHLESEKMHGPTEAIHALYRDAGLKPADMNLWMLYDGISFWAMQWMERLGLVPLGESGNYVDDGKRIRFDGETPLNPHGGQLSEGRMHGSGHILEAVQQLRGNAGPRQARRADTAIISFGIPTYGSMAILGRDAQ